MWKAQIQGLQAWLWASGKTSSASWKRLGSPTLSCGSVWGRREEGLHLLGDSVSSSVQAKCSGPFVGTSRRWGVEKAAGRDPAS